MGPDQCLSRLAVAWHFFAGIVENFCPRVLNLDLVNLTRNLMAPKVHLFNLVSKAVVAIRTDKAFFVSIDDG